MKIQVIKKATPKAGADAFARGSSTFRWRTEEELALVKLCWCRGGAGR